LPVGGEDRAPRHRLLRRSREGGRVQLVTGEAGQGGDEGQGHGGAEEPQAAERQLGRRAPVGDRDRPPLSGRRVCSREGGVGAQRHTVLSSSAGSGTSNTGAGSGAATATT